jgi:hypothetical protein
MEILTIERVDRVIRFLGVCHLYECESPRLTRITIPYKVYAVDLTVPSEERFNISFSSRKRKVSDVDILHERSPFGVVT